MNLSNRDELLVQRHLDGELSAPEAAAFTARLAAEPALREGHRAAAALRGAFAAAREVAGPRPRAGFKAAVLGAVRQLPTRLQLEQAELAERTIAFCRRLLLAAALLAGIAFAVGAGLLGGVADQPLQASPAEMQREIDRLEQIVRDRPAIAPVRDAR